MLGVEGEPDEPDGLVVPSTVTVDVTTTVLFAATTSV